MAKAEDLDDGFFLRDEPVEDTSFQFTFQPLRSATTEEVKCLYGQLPTAVIESLGSLSLTGESQYEEVTETHRNLWGIVPIGSVIEQLPSDKAEAKAWLNGLLTGLMYGVSGFTKSTRLETTEPSKPSMDILLSSRPLPEKPAEASPHP